MSRLEVMVDSALDCVNLLVTTESQQWRVLIEQRSTGYVWGCAGDLTTCHVPPSPQQTRVNGHNNEADDTGAVQRTRLQSIKQMSVDRITNLRNRYTGVTSISTQYYMFHTDWRRVGRC